MMADENKTGETAETAEAAAAEAAPRRPRRRGSPKRLRAAPRRRSEAAPESGSGAPRRLRAAPAEAAAAASRPSSGATPRAGASAAPAAARRRRRRDNRGGGNRGRRDERGRGRGGDDEGGEELIEKLVHINRVSKTVKGGKRFGFAALVVVGDGKGRAGFGHGKAREVPEAISKATAAAKKAMVRVPLRDGRTLHHDGLGHFGAGRVYVRSAPAGTGIIAGGPMRAVFESLGVADVVTKSIGTSNPYNMIRATFEALGEQTSPKSVAQRRGKKIADLMARREGVSARPRLRPKPKRWWSKRDGQDQDHPDRIADPPHRRPARDAGRPRASTRCTGRSSSRTRPRSAA